MAKKLNIFVKILLLLLSWIFEYFILFGIIPVLLHKNSIFDFSSFGAVFLNCLYFGIAYYTFRFFFKRKTKNTDVDKKYTHTMD